MDLRELCVYKFLKPSVPIFFMLKHILFDNDGTIVDSEIIAVQVMLQHLKTAGVEISQAPWRIREPGEIETRPHE